MRFTIVILFFNLCAFSQLSEVVILDSTYKQSHLYKNSLKWYAKTFKSSNDVIQMKDEVTGEIIGKFVLNTVPRAMGVNQGGSTYATMSLSIRDGKYRYTLSDIYFKYIDPRGKTLFYEKDPGGMTHKMWDRWKSEVDAEIKTITEGLKTEIINKDDF